MAALDNIASELIKSANEADLIYKKTRDQAQLDKAVRLRRIVENLLQLSGGTATLDQVTTAGNTTANTINVGGITSDYFQLDTAATPTLAPGMFAWNDAYGTADLRLKGNNVTLQVGQETLARVVNKTGADLLESQYKVVRVRIASEGGAQGQRLAVVLAQGNNDPDSATTLGLVTENIANNQEGFITIFGNVNNINTTGSLQGETWVDGDVLYLSPTTPGSLTKVKPVAPQHTVIIGYVVYAHNNQGKIFVKVDNGYELDELHNVLITSPANNDLLQYNSTQQVWKNIPVGTAVPTPTLAQVTTAGNTTTNAITVGGLTSNGNVNVGSNFVGNGTMQYVHFTGGSGEFRFKNGSGGGWYYTWCQNGSFGTEERMRLSSGNNLLIGTTTDSGYRLDVNGTGRFSDTLLATANASNHLGLIVQPNSQGNAVFRYLRTATTNFATFEFANGSVSSSVAKWGIGLRETNDNDFHFYNHTASKDQLVIKDNTGNVLVGTTTDAGYKLDVNGTARVVNKTNIGSETVSQGSLYIGHNGTAGGNNGTSTVFFVSQFGNYPYRLGAEGNGYDFFLRQVNGGQGSVNIDFSGLNSIQYNIINTNVLNQAFSKSAIINAKATLNSYFAIGTSYGGSNSTSSGDSPLIFFRSMDGSYYDKTLDAAVTIRNGLPTVADNNITKNTAYWYRNGYIGIGTSTTLSATNTLKGAITINQGTTIGYQNLTPGSLSSVITSGTSTIVSFTPNNGNNVPGYDIVVGTIITANGVSRRVTAVNYQTVTVDSAVDWSAGYNYTYRNPYVSIADGSTPIFDILPSGNVAVGTTTAIAKFTVSGSITASTALAQGVYFNNTLVAAANNDVLVGLDINPTFTNGAFTGVGNIGLRVSGQVLFNAYGAYNTVTPTLRIENVDTNNVAIQIKGNVANYKYYWIYDSQTTEGIYKSDQARIDFYGGTDVGFAFRNNYGRLFTIVGSTGNLLIGTTTDAGYKLDVNGTIRSSGTNGFILYDGTYGAKTSMVGYVFTIQTEGANGPTVYNFKYSDNSDALYLSNTAIRGVPAYDAVMMSRSVYAPHNGAFGFVTYAGTTQYKAIQAIYTDNNTSGVAFNYKTGGTDTEAMRITSAGNVGIGTSSPTDKFHIVDNTNGNKFGRISAGGTNASAAWVAQNDQVDNIVYRVFGSAVTGSQMGQALARSASLIANLGGTGKFLIGSYSGTDLIFGTSDQARMRLVDATGNFLIGTMTDTGNKLTVSGNIDAQGYKVNNVLGYTGILNIPTNPPGQQNIDIQGGIVINIF